MPQWLVNDRRTSSEAFRVFCYFARTDEWCRRSIVQISVDLRMTPAKVKEALKVLYARKLVQCGPTRKYRPTPRRATPYGLEHWCPVPVDAVTAMTARSLRVLASVGQSRLRRVPDPTVGDLVAVCGFESGKACKPSTIKTALRELRKGGWFDHMLPPVPPPPPPVIMDGTDPDSQEEPVDDQPELISVDVLRDIVEGPLTPQNDPDRFQEFWRAYPRRVGKGNARKAWVKALKKTTAQTMIDAAKRFTVWSRHTEARFIPHPATWLNGERWDDEPDPQHYKLSASEEQHLKLEELKRFYRERGE